MNRSYSLEEVAEAHLPAEWTDSVRWLRRRLNRKQLKGFRVGRVWRMTDDDVEFLIRKHHNFVEDQAPEPYVAEGPALSFVDGLSDSSRSRLRRRSA